MNVKLLRRIQKYILAEPKRLVMLGWGGKYDLLCKSGWSRLRDLAKSSPPCGTVGCIAGWACQLSAKSKADLKFNSAGLLTLYKNDPIQEAASALLGLNREDDQDNRLFKLPEQTWRGSWPKELAEQYLKAKTPRGRARIVANRIDLFIKTKGME